LLVNLVGQDRDLSLQHGISDGGEFAPVINDPGRIRRAVEHQELRPRRQRSRELVGTEFEAGLLGRRDEDRRGPGQLHQIGIADPVWGGDDDLIPRPAQRHQGIMDRMLGAVRDQDLIGAGRQADPSRVVIRQRLLQLRDAGRRGVVGLAGPDRAERSLLDVRRRVEVGLTQGEVEDVHPLPFEPPGFGGHRQRG